MLPVLTALFVPGSRPDRFAKADDSGADSIILDLEDAVAPGDKQRARDAVESWLLSAPQAASRSWIRINPPDSPFFAADAGLLTGLQERGRAPARVLLPKAERVGDLDALDGSDDEIVSPEQDEDDELDRA